MLEFQELGVAQPNASCTPLSEALDLMEQLSDAHNWRRPSDGGGWHDIRRASGLGHENVLVESAASNQQAPGNLRMWPPHA